jgi:hypothetical protein
MIVTSPLTVGHHHCLGNGIDPNIIETSGAQQRFDLVLLIEFEALIKYSSPNGAAGRYGPKNQLAARP